MRRSSVKSSKKLLTLSDAARRLDVGFTTIERAIARGEFKPVMLNGRRRISAAAVDALLAYDNDKMISAHTATYSMQEVATVLGVSRQTIYNAIKRGELRSAKINGRRIVPRVAIDELLAGEGPAEDIARDARRFRALEMRDKWSTVEDLPTFHLDGVQYRSLGALADALADRHCMGLREVPAIPVEVENTLEATG